MFYQFIWRLVKTNVINQYVTNMYRNASKPIYTRCTNVA